MVISINKNKKDLKSQTYLTALFFLCISLTASPVSSARDTRSAHIGSRLCRVVATFAALAQGGTAFSADPVHTEIPRPDFSVESIGDLETRGGNICKDVLLSSVSKSFASTRGIIIEFYVKKNEKKYFCICGGSEEESNQLSCKIFESYDEKMKYLLRDSEDKISSEVDTKGSYLPSSSGKDTTTTSELTLASVSTNKFHAYLEKMKYLLRDSEDKISSEIDSKGSYLPSSSGKDTTTTSELTLASVSTNKFHAYLEDERYDYLDGGFSFSVMRKMPGQKLTPEIIRSKIFFGIIERL